MIIPIYKPIGASSHQLAKTVGEKYGDENPEKSKATHTGTLDPMAEGVLIVLTGKDRFKKTEFSNWKKEYEFEVLFSFKTDSFDLLGLVTEQNNKEEIEIDRIENTLPSFIGKQIQTVPKFSAQRVGGKSGFDLAKAGKEFELQKNKVEIFSLEILKESEINGEELLKNIQNKISKVGGDFRQTEILETWKEILNQPNNFKKKFKLIKFKATTSKRTYIRALVRDLAKKLNTNATTFSIVRTKNGGFGVEDCKQLTR